MREVKDDNHFTGIGQMVKIARVFPRVTNATVVGFAKSGGVEAIL